MERKIKNKYGFEIYNGRVKVKYNGAVMFTFNQIDFLGYYSFKDDSSLFGISFFFLREGAGGYTFDFYSKTKENWLAVLKLLDENM